MKLILAIILMFFAVFAWLMVWNAPTWMFAAFGLIYGGCARLFYFAQQEC